MKTVAAHVTLVLVFLTTPVEIFSRDLKTSFLNMPLSFIENRGQTDPCVLYFERSSGHTTSFTRQGVSFTFSGKDKGSIEPVTLTPLDTSSFTIEAVDRQEGKVNYILGKDPKNWQADIPTYGAILYRNAYPGIDMKFYGTNSQLEYDIIVSPGADPSKIRLSYENVEKLSLSADGNLGIVLKEGAMYQKQLSLYQVIDGKRSTVNGRFILDGTHTYGFEVGPYQKDHTLFIDPVLTYATYLGGSGDDSAAAIAVDSSGNAYVAGTTNSANFPTLNGHQGSNAGGIDIFVTKLSPTGALIYSTYFGGEGDDDVSHWGNSIAVDSSGNAYLAGSTTSADFPIVNGYQGSKSGDRDGFVLKLNASGNGVVYSTYLGGSDSDDVYGVAVDLSGSIYVTGETRSQDFPTMHPFHGPPPEASVWSAFVAKFNPVGNLLVYSTFLDADGTWGGIAVDSSGYAYVAGQLTRSIGGATPTQLAYVAKVNPEGTGLAYENRFGGKYASGGAAVENWALGIAIDSSGCAYVTGQTSSLDFPVVNAYQGSNRNSKDAFVTKFDPEGNTVFSTYLGGEDDDIGWAIAVDGSGNIWVAGRTGSPSFPVTADAYQTSKSSGYDWFITKFNSQGSSLVYSTFLGGQGAYDTAYGIAVDPSGNAYVAGNTESVDFPTRNAQQPAKAGGFDAFIVKFGDMMTLTVNTSGPGIHTVTSSPPGIDCGSTCLGDFSPGTSVTLNASNDPGFAFSGWTGCDSSSGNKCTVVMTANKSVNAAWTESTGPASITLLSPSEGAVFDSRSFCIGYQPGFEWAAEEPFKKYTVYFSSSPTDFSTRGVLITKASVSAALARFVPRIALWKSIMSSSYNKGDIREVYWKVVGTKKDKKSAESEVRSLRVSAIEPVVIHDPLNGAGLNAPPHFNFTGNGNIKFKLEISSEATFDNPRMIKSFTYTIKDPNIDETLDRALTPSQWTTIKKLIGRGYGYFRIRAWDGIKREILSEVGAFTIVE